MTQDRPTTSDSVDPHEVARARMVRDQLVARGITDERVLAAMGEVPRERFVPPGAAPKAYDDCALALDYGQTISQPYIVALMTQALRVEAHHRVLEVGTGSGYQTAVLSRLARYVYTIERVAALASATRSRLEALGVKNVSYRIGDGSVGWPKEAPFDCITVTAGAPTVPTVLGDQLVEGGRLVIPVGKRDRQTLVVVERRGDRTVEQSLVPCRFVNLIGQAGWADSNAPSES